MLRQAQHYSVFQTFSEHFLRAISHSLGANVEVFQFTSDDKSDDDDNDVDSAPSATANASVTAVAATATPQRDTCKVCLTAPSFEVAFVLCAF